MICRGNMIVFPRKTSSCPGTAITVPGTDEISMKDDFILSMLKLITKVFTVNMNIDPS